MRFHSSITGFPTKATAFFFEPLRRRTSAPLRRGSRAPGCERPADEEVPEGVGAADRVEDVEAGPDAGQGPT